MRWMKHYHHRLTNPTQIYRAQQTGHRRMRKACWMCVPGEASKQDKTTHWIWAARTHRYRKKKRHRSYSMPGNSIVCTHTTPLPRKMWFTIKAHHDSLNWILNLTDSTGQFARWRLRVSEYDFDVVSSAGIKRQDADAIFRLETTGED